MSDSPTLVKVRAIHAVQRRLSVNDPVVTHQPTSEFDLFEHEVAELLKLGAVSVVSRYVPPAFAQIASGVAVAGVEAVLQHVHAHARDGQASDEGNGSTGSDFGADQGEAPVPPANQDAPVDPVDDQGQADAGADAGAKAKAPAATKKAASSNESLV